MQVFDLKTMNVAAPEEKGKNVFYKSEQLKARLIELPAGGKIPECQMETHVLFYVIEGEAQVTVNQEKAFIKEGQCLITPPATVSMKTDAGVRVLGITFNPQVVDG